MSSDDILKRYGYSVSAPTIGRWPVSGALDRLSSLPEALRLMDAGKQKIRIVFDYDPIQLLYFPIWTPSRKSW